MAEPGTVPAAVVRAYAVEIRRLHDLLDQLGISHVEGEVASERLSRFVNSYRAARIAIRKAGG